MFASFLMSSITIWIFHLWQYWHLITVLLAGESKLFHSGNSVKQILSYWFFFLIRRGGGTMGKHISYWHIICLFPGDVKRYGTWFYSQGFRLLCSFWICSFSLCFLDALTAFLVLYILFIVDFFRILWVSAPVYLLSLFWALIVL